MFSQNDLQRKISQPECNRITKISLLKEKKESIRGSIRKNFGYFFKARSVMIAAQPLVKSGRSDTKMQISCNEGVEL
jgi:hypothetical protein